MKMKVSRLFAVTLFTPNRMVRSSLPWEKLIHTFSTLLLMIKHVLH